jgi:hypothetical protein
VHTDSPETSVAVVADAQPPTGLRRRLIGAGLIGVAGSLVPRFAARATASTPDDTTETTTATAATTTTAPPQQPTTEDVDVLGFAQSIELAAAQLYEMAVDGGSLGDEVLAVVTPVHQAHVAYAQALNGLLGRKAPGQILTSLVESSSEGFGGDEAAFLAAAYQLEDTAVATHTELIGQIEGTDGAGLLASILIAEARHATVFADLAGESDLDALLLTTAEPLAAGEG